MLRNIKCALGFHYSWCTEIGGEGKIWCNNCKEPKVPSSLKNDIGNWVGFSLVGALLGVAIILSI